MKKTITFLCAGFLTLGLSAQNFGVGLDYMMLSGTMVEESEDHDHDHAGEEHDEISTSSAVLNLSYAYSINDDMSAVLSAGYGMGFGIVPLKASLSYGVSSSISVNAGMGMYMITDEGYSPMESPEGAVDADGNELSWKGSSNEFGGGAGIAYHMNNIGLGLGYEMIKGGDHSSLNSFTISLSYSFGGGSGGESAPAAPAGK
tara:strand:- start:6860 stop:7465 length:606 start_codon:yes stop_codon:yes gene_type:complete